MVEGKLDGKSWPAMHWVSLGVLLVCRRLTGFRGEDVLVVEQILDPGHDIINVCGCGEVDALSILVDPSVVEALSGESSQRMHGGGLEDTYFGPADMVGHECWVQHSEMTP